MSRADRLTVEVSANMTVSDEMANRCLRLLEMWQYDNPDKCIYEESIKTETGRKTFFSIIWRKELESKDCEMNLAQNGMKVKLDPGAFAPVRAHPTDAGLDLRTPIAVKVPAHGAVSIDTGVHIELPHGTYGKLESKSGLNVNHCVVSLGGTIDEPYRGSIVAKLYNLSDRDYWFSEGDKVVQLIILPYLAPDIEIVDELTETDRGDNGFGSSGK